MRDSVVQCVYAPLNENNRHSVRCNWVGRIIHIQDFKKMGRKSQRQLEHTNRSSLKKHFEGLRHLAGLRSPPTDARADSASNPRSVGTRFGGLYAQFANDAVVNPGHESATTLLYARFQDALQAFG